MTEIPFFQRRRIVCGLLLGALLALTVPTSYALADSTSSSTAAISTNVAAAVASQGEVAPTTLDTVGNTFVAQGDSASVTIPRDPDSPTTVEGDGSTVGLAVPETADGTRVGSTVVYDQRNGADIAEQSIPDGLRALLDIPDGAATHDYPFQLTGDVARVSSNPDGSLTLLDSSGQQIGSIDAPWATDANGDPVPTHFVVGGTSVTQVVDFDNATAFPVTADPAIHLHWTTYTLELWPTDQRAIVAGASVLAVDLVCKKVPGLTAACEKAAKPFQAALTVYVAKNFHPHCHLNLSFFYGTVPPALDRIWTSQCT